MLSWIIQITIISIVLIFLVHYLFNFFKSTLTVPKIKDLVNIPNQKYKNMYNIISKNNETFNNENINNENNNQHNYTDIDLLPKLDTEFIPNTESNSNSNSDSMKNELKQFLKKQLKDPSTDISTLNSSKYSYSDY
jgi:hypothetical protein